MTFWIVDVGFVLIWVVCELDDSRLVDHIIPNL